MLKKRKTKCMWTGRRLEPSVTPRAAGRVLETEVKDAKTDLGGKVASTRIRDLKRQVSPTAALPRGAVSTKGGET